jgi:hypothetical protein
MKAELGRRLCPRSLSKLKVQPMDDAMTTYSHVTELMIAVGLLLGLLAALESGYRLGLRDVAARGNAPSGGQIGAIQGAMLGLLGLLLGLWTTRAPA